MLSRRALLALAALPLAGCGSSSPTALRPIGAAVNGPAGLRASIYSSGVPTAAGLALDPQGRLWVAAAGLSTHAADGVYVVARAGDPARRVITGLKDPLGLLWLGRRLYVASIGRVDAFSGFDGRRFARRRTILAGPARGAENNYLLLSAAGRLILGITATCDHCARPAPLSGAVVSFKPDGGDLRVYARRIRAPIAFAYYPGTSDLLATFNQRDDLGARTPGDWLALIREGEDWRFPDCYGQGGPTCSGVPAPVAVLDKHAAVGGVVIATGQLGSAVGTAALVAEWQSAKVQRVALRRTSSGYSGAVTPFLTGIRNPLALLLMTDRSLLVADWASGRIYRIRATG
jgi:glucose/arabinose dehydrogenase